MVLKYSENLLTDEQVQVVNISQLGYLNDILINI